LKINWRAEKPASMGTDICKSHLLGVDKDKCNPNCPFYIECEPYFVAMAQYLEEVMSER
jgi:hypothetical protein